MSSVLSTSPTLMPSQRPYQEPRQVLLTPAEAGKYLSIAPATLANWRSAGNADAPAYVKVGGRVRYRLTDLDAFIDARTVTAAAATALPTRPVLDPDPPAQPARMGRLPVQRSGR